MAKYSYLASGSKTEAEDGSGAGLVYRGSLIYKKASNGTLTFDGGEKFRQHFTGKEDQAPDFTVPFTDFGARQYSPALRRWLVPDPLSEKYYGISPYAYCAGDPVNLVDKDGRDAVLVVFPDYEIHVGERRYKHLGHAGVLLINNETGYTRYYEYGRYDSENKGIVRNIRVSNVIIGKNNV